MTLDWATVANLILELGLPAVERIIQNWENNQAVSVAEFQSIAAMADRTSKDRMLSRLVAAGIDPASVQGKILLGLTDAPVNVPTPVPVTPVPPQTT